MTACRAFVHVAARGSFTAGAAAGQMAQSVASRKIAALEAQLGDALLDRSARHVRLTPFGERLLPSAQRLVHAADELLIDAEAGRGAPLRLAVPEAGTVPLARLIHAAHHRGLPVDAVAASPRERRALLTDARVAAVVEAVPVSEARWRAPLGLAGDDRADDVSSTLESLRPRRRAGVAPRRVWVQPEDDVPHVRDPLVRRGNAVGLLPSQIVLAPSSAAAVAGAFAGDLLMCTAHEAGELGLPWSVIHDLAVWRAHGVTAARPVVADRIRDVLGLDIAAYLGAEPTGRSEGGSDA